MSTKDAFSIETQAVAELFTALPRDKRAKVHEFLEQVRQEYAQELWRADVSFGQLDPADENEALSKEFATVMCMNDSRRAWWALQDNNGVFAYVATETDAALLQRMYRLIKNRHPVKDAPLPGHWHLLYEDMAPVLEALIGGLK